ncbi:MAG TPA: PKD domain-containing protein, partial [Chitinophagaceae bacterium]|nr:PKD domain-containing protein [Chitinophagaceae bacterium]
MKKTLLLLMLFTGWALTSRADHITGGEMYYSYIGNANGRHQYKGTLKLYRSCFSSRQLNANAIISVFNRNSNVRVQDIDVSLTRTETLEMANTNKCITDPPPICYEVGYYEFEVSLPSNSEGYLLVGQFVYRVNSLQNLVGGYGRIGATYTAEIPGTAGGMNLPQNNNARFIGSDLVVICADNRFQYSFQATDEDGDDLRYSFCAGYMGGENGNIDAFPPFEPPYSSLPYGSGYSSGAPLGPEVSIDSRTGLITGTAPAQEGYYVVTVCVEEVRNGRVIARKRKDIQINIAPCTIAGAKLEPEYQLCRDTRTLTVTNLSTSPLITTQYWEFQNRSGAILYTSTDKNGTYTFADTGLYYVRLVINRGGDCTDSTLAPVKVYPGFRPAFTALGICATNPSRFRDRSTSVYGVVNSWQWDFGEPGAADDAAQEQQAEYTYPSTGNKTVLLRVTNTVGCTDTVSQILSIITKPPITLGFRDTLICR